MSSRGFTGTVPEMAAMATSVKATSVQWLAVTIPALVAVTVSVIAWNELCDEKRWFVTEAMVCEEEKRWFVRRSDGVVEADAGRYRYAADPGPLPYPARRQWLSGGGGAAFHLPRQESRARDRPDRPEGGWRSSDPTVRARPPDAASWQGAQSHVR